MGCEPCSWSADSKAVSSGQIGCACSESTRHGKGPEARSGARGQRKEAKRMVGGAEAGASWQREVQTLNKGVSRDAEWKVKARQSGPNKCRLPARSKCVVPRSCVRAVVANWCASERW